MPNLNKVLLMGHLTRTPEIRYTPAGTAVADFGMAVNTKFGENEEVLFVDVTCFSKTAENVATYLHKGDAAFIEGRLRLETWTDKSGNKRSKHKVLAQRVQFLGQKGSQTETETTGENIGVDDNPF